MVERETSEKNFQDKKKVGRAVAYQTDAKCEPKGTSMPSQLIYFLSDIQITVPSHPLQEAEGGLLSQRGLFVWQTNWDKRRNN